MLWQSGYFLLIKYGGFFTPFTLFRHSLGKEDDIFQSNRFEGAFTSLVFQIIGKMLSKIYYVNSTYNDSYLCNTSF